MRKIASFLALIICISIGVFLSSFSSSASRNNTKTKPTVSNPPKTNPSQTKDTLTTDSPSKSTPSPYTTIVPEYNCTVIEYDVFNKINKARTSAGLHTLEWSDELYRAAKIRASEIVIKESHYRPDGSSCFTVSNELSRENIAFGYSSAELVYEGWMNSSGHKENILAKDAHTCAISLHIASTDYKYYWVNAFGR